MCYGMIAIGFCYQTRYLDKKNSLYAYNYCNILLMRGEKNLARSLINSVLDEDPSFVNFLDFSSKIDCSPCSASKMKRRKYLQSDLAKLCNSLWLFTVLKRSWRIIQITPIAS